MCYYLHWSPHCSNQSALPQPGQNLDRCCLSSEPMPAVTVVEGDVAAVAAAVAVAPQVAGFALEEQKACLFFEETWPNFLQAEIG